MLTAAAMVVLIVVVAILILLNVCFSVDLLDCCYYHKDRKVFQFFPEFNVRGEVSSFFHEVEKIEIFFLGFVGPLNSSVEWNQKQQIFKTANVDSFL